MKRKHHLFPIAAAMLGGLSAIAAPVDVPYCPDFGNKSSFTNWEIVDANQDGYSWAYDENNKLVRIYTMYSPKDFNDDYLCLPPVNLGSDDIYTLTFSYGSQASESNNLKSEKMRITFGTNPSPSQNPSIFEDDNIRYFWNGKMRTVTLTLPVTNDAPHYIAFHCTSPNTAYSLSVKDVKVEQNGSHAAPAAVSGLRATAIGTNCSNCKLEFTMPTTDADGKALTSISKATVYRDGASTPVYTIDEPFAGSKQSWTDTNAAAGMHTYTVTAWAGNEEGAKAETSVWLGDDVPLKPATIAAKTVGNNVSINWAPAEATHNGYLGNMTYELSRVTGDETTLVASNLKSTEFTDIDANAAGAQKIISYRVIAKTSAGESEAAYSRGIITGTPYSLPIVENFGFGKLKTAPWSTEVEKSGFMTAQWSMNAQGFNPLCPTIDGDDGMLGYMAKPNDYFLAAGSEVRMTTPAISLSDTKAPVLSFMLFHYDTSVIEREYDEETGDYKDIVTKYNDAVRVQIAKDNGLYEDLPNGRIMLNANNKGWTRYEFPLSDYKNTERISIGLLGEAEGGGNIFIDAFEINDTHANDLELKTLIGNGSAAPGQEAKFVAQVVNRGASSTKDYTVSLYADGKKVATEKNPGAAIFNNLGEKLIHLSWTPDASLAGKTIDLYAELEYNADECEANNRSEIIKFEVPGVRHPGVDGLTGSVQEGLITLTWQKPDTDSFVPTRRENAENLTAFAVSGYGDFTTSDYDKYSTYSASGNLNYPHIGEAMAWQVFNPREAGLDIDLAFNRRWISHSGEQYICCWGSQEGQNDDWLISPRLSGREQTISFWIKSACQAYDEKFEVLYSDATSALADFDWVAKVSYRPTSQWRQFTITLPEGSHYFAIRGTTNDGFAQMVDDLDFERLGDEVTELELKGYHVHQDGIKITSAPVQTTSHSFKPTDNGSHKYTVTAVYGTGESSHCQPLELTADESAVTGTEASEFRAWSAEGRIWFSGQQGEVEIFGIDGAVVCTVNTAGRSAVSVTPGIYLVRNAEKSIKIQVK
ncbi:MAG: choice-of-anchor J domain-containing protein [Muribaculaceae bacterium]|nr:choice-of-anchor J domain-containing protein [Muribaculaceae bacterium]